MKMSKKNYRIDFAANTVTVTKKFLEEAESNITSAAFKDMKALRAMGLTVVVKETKHTKSKHISYEQMVHYISCVENSEFSIAGGQIDMENDSALFIHDAADEQLTVGGDIRHRRQVLHHEWGKIPRA